MQIISAAIMVLHDVGVERADVDQIADTAGISVDALRQHFPTWQSLLTATVDRWSSTLSRPLLPIAEQYGAVAYLHALIVAYSEEPALMRLLASTLAASSDPANEGADYYRTLCLRFRQTICDALERDIHAGREPDTMELARATEQLLALCDGLRVQALLVPEIDIIEAFDRAASRMRRGWSEDYRHTDLFDIPSTAPANTRHTPTHSAPSKFALPLEARGGRRLGDGRPARSRNHPTAAPQSVPRQ